MGKERVALFSLVRSGLALVVVRPIKDNLVLWEPSCATFVSNPDTLLENAELPRARVPFPHPSWLRVMMMGKGCKVECTP